MRIRFSELLIVIGLGVICLVGAVRLEYEMKHMGIILVAGPAKYIGLISLFLIACGVGLIIEYTRRRKFSGSSVDSPIASSRVIILTSVMFGYVVVVPIVGYLIGTICFFPLLFQASGMRPWHKSILAGALMAVLFFVAFVLLAKLPMPKGRFG